MHNPFNPYQPAEGPLFANRKREQEWFARDFIPSLAPDSLGTYNAAILGPWGIGKSSLVRQLRFMTVAMAADQPAMAFLSCTAGFGSLMGVCAAIVNTLRQEVLRLSRWDQALMDELDRWSFEFRVPGLSARRQQRKTPENTVSAAEFLRQALLHLWEKAFRALGYGVIIVLDDVNLLQTIDPNALMLLRAVFQDLHMYHARYALVVTGPTDLFSGVRDIAEPLTRFFEHLTLTALSRDDVGGAIREPIRASGVPLRVDDDAVSWIWERTQGHPYFVTYMMHYVFQTAIDQGWDRITPTRLQTQWPNTMARLARSKFMDDWNAATPSEQQALLALAQGHAGVANRGLVTRLIRKGLVTKIDRGQYRLYHPLFQEYVLAIALAPP